MPIYSQDDSLVFISEDPTADEKEKVQSINWTEIETIDFIYPKTGIWLKIISSLIALTAFIFASADTTGTYYKPTIIVVKLKNGQTINKEFPYLTTKDRQAFERKLLNRLTP